MRPVEVNWNMSRLDTKPKLRPTAILLRWCAFLGCVVWMLAIAGTVLAEGQSVVESSAKIDALIQAKWDAEGVTPAADASESEIVRRVYLDLVGRIPTREERQNYLDDGRSDKRHHLVDLLLKSEDHVQHFADLFDAMLMGRRGAEKWNQRRQSQWRAYLERVFRTNRPWDEVVNEILLARPQSNDDRGVVWFLYERNNDHQAIAEAVAPAFFGIRIECAQCHDHMIASEIEQKHYWGLVAFFNRGKNEKTKNGPRVVESAVGGFSEFANLEGSSSPNVLAFLEAATVEEPRPGKDDHQEDSDELYEPAQHEGEPKQPKFSRRQKFVEEVVTDHPLVARALVNRVWAMVMGRGIVHPFDEMDSIHVPSHPQLLDWLAQDFRDHGYDIRRLTRMIVLSKAYQLESRHPTGVDDPALFAWSIERPLTAEQLLRSMQLAVRAEYHNDDPLGHALRKSFPDVLPETVTTPVSNALYLTNNQAINDFITKSNGENHLVSRLMKLESRDEQMTLLFETIYGRDANPEERERIEQFLSSTTSKEEQQRNRWHQVVWALITSAEFRLNH